ncbi:MAG: extracellular solute-binding protein, partial [Silicimonas sp.]|nr:extracellular solute-binding protein [Silicimonas sp.]
MSNSFGARWFDEEWNAQFDTEAWANTLNFYKSMMDESGPPGYATNGFNENLSLFNQGKCGMWIDATVAASFVTNPNDSEVADSVGFALAPDTGLGKRSNWLWAWALAIPAGTQNEAAAKEFIEWATSKDYIELVAANEGWANVPPGARKSLYENPNYAEVPFAQKTLDSILSADPNDSTVEPSPYVGIQFAAIPEFAGIATEVSQEFSAAYAGQQTIEEALEKAQAITNDAMEAAGYR